MNRGRDVVGLAFAALLTVGGIRVAVAEDVKPSKMESVKKTLKENKARVEACRKEAIERNIPKWDRATYEEECRKKMK